MLARNILSLTEARKNIFSLVEEVDTKETSFILTERGRAKAALIPIALFDSFSEHSRSTSNLLSWYQEGIITSLGAPVWVARDGCQEGYQRNALNPWEEERGYARSILYVKLVEQFGYGPHQIEIGHPVELVSKSEKRHLEIDLMVRNNEGLPIILCMLTPVKATAAEQEAVTELLYTLAKHLNLQTTLCFLAVFSHECKEKKTKSKAFVIDYKKYPTFALWQAGGKKGRKELVF